VSLAASDGTLTAKNVVVATNAWAASLRRLRNKLFVISSDIIVTESIPDRLAQIGCTGGEAITDSQTLVCYYRTTAEGRIAFGKGGWSIGYGGHMPEAMHRDAGRVAMVARDFRRYYPNLRETAIVSDWAGPIDRTYKPANLRPALRQLQHSLWRRLVGQRRGAERSRRQDSRLAGARPSRRMVRQWPRPRDG
jgi:glycine/D-amino acid oxidase-like deaminating enzyme